MADDDRKRIASAFWKLMGETRFDEAQALLAPDAVFLGRETPPMPLSGYFPLISAIYQAAPITHHDVKILVDGDDVAYNARGESTLPNGAEYNNDYVFMMVVQGGKIHSIKEYSDTAYAGAVLIPSLPPSLLAQLMPAGPE